MKKILLRVVVVVLVLCQLCGALHGCTKNEPNNDASYALTKDNIADYVIITPASADSGIKVAANQLQASIKNTYGVELTVKTDKIEQGSDVYCEQECEILVGKTNRTQSETFFAQLKQNDSGYSMIDKKVILGGYDADTVAKSVTAWSMDVLAKATDIIMDKSIQRIISGSYTYSSFEINGISLCEYKIVYPISDKFGESTFAGTLMTYLKDTTGYMLECVPDTAEASAHEIWIGQTNRITAEMSNARQASGFTGKDCYIAADDNGIWISGSTQRALNSGIYKFLKLASEDGKIQIDEPKKYSVTELSVSTMTYNILYNNITSSRSETLLSFIEQENSDIFGCNEVVPAWTEKLTNKFSATYDTVEGKPSSGSTNGMRNSVFWKKDKFDLLESGTLWFSDTPDIKSKYAEAYKYVTCTYVKLRDKASGVEFVYIQVHLENTGDNPQAPTARKKQSEALKKITERFKFLPIIVGGDFNAGNIGDISPFYRGTRFVNTYDIAETKTGTKGTWVEKNVISKNWTLDYIFVSKDCIDVKKHESIDNKKDGIYPSDHLPVKIQAVIYQ